MSSPELITPPREQYYGDWNQELVGVQLSVFASASLISKAVQTEQARLHAWTVITEPSSPGYEAEISFIFRDFAGELSAYSPDPLLNDIKDANGNIYRIYVAEGAASGNWSLKFDNSFNFVDAPPLHSYSMKITKTFGPTTLLRVYMARL